MMTDLEKVSRVELALRAEANTLRHTKSIESSRAAEAIDRFLTCAGVDSKLRLANILMDAGKVAPIVKKTKANPATKPTLRVAK